MTDSPALPKPVQAGGPPIIVGGKGPHADAGAGRAVRRRVQLPFATIDVFREQRDRVVAGLRGDRPRSGLDDLVGGGGAVLRRPTRPSRAAGGGDRARPDELRRNGAAGTPDEVGGDAAGWNAAGADRIYLQMLDLSDLEHLDLVAEQVAPDLD